MNPTSESQRKEVEPLEYTWEEWERPTFHERKKRGFEILGEAYDDKHLEEPRAR